MCDCRRETRKAKVGDGSEPAAGHMYGRRCESGDGRWADKIERCIFNAGIGSVDEEFKSLQYFSGLNQVIADSSSNHGDYFKGREWMSYRPIPDVECCAGNVNRFMPNYCARMWMQKGEDIFAVLYGPSEAAFTVNDSKVQIQQQTAYPFQESIRFRFTVQEPCAFRFHVRIPSWCENAGILVNGERVAYEAEHGFARIDRVFESGDCIVLELPSEIKICEYKGEGCYVEKGPLVYAYSVNAVKIPITGTPKTTEDFPAYDMYPDTAWNYALCTASEDGASPVFLNLYPDAAQEDMPDPWTLTGCHYKIQVTARKVNGWELERTDIVQSVHNLYDVPWKYVEEKGKFTFTPRFPDEAFIAQHGYDGKETITLVPMAVTQLRMTIFPKA